MKPEIRNRYFFLLDLIILTLLPAIALTLRINLPWGTTYLPGLLAYTLVALLVKIAVFYFTGIYRRYWPYASIDALLALVIAVGLGCLLAILAFYALPLIPLGARPLPRSLPFIDSLLTIALIPATRFSPRLLRYTAHRRHKAPPTARRVLIAGAGEAGQTIAREITNSQFVALHPVGFIDDDPAKIGTLIHGIPVLGSLDALPDLARRHYVQEVIIAMPAAPGHIIRRILAAAERAALPTRTLPGLYELLNGRVSVNRLRKVEINDLLRRQPVESDLTQVQALLQDRTVLVTGAGGSIGSELCRQILACQPAALIALGHGENSLHQLQSKLEFDPSTRNPQPSPAIHFLVADVRDPQRLQVIFQRHQPHIVFHAAAHKHVPLMEHNLEDAVTNNIIGTWNLVQAALQHRVQHFVLISTDKAVQPVNIMGLTKRIAEVIVGAAALTANRPYVAVRFGNVLGSRGSVIPRFQQQIAAGGPLTLTHPDMERYFMTIPEAVQLVLQAAALGETGQTFVLDMGQPLKIIDLARDMIELSGLQVESDIAIQFTGLRPGERLTEYLFDPGETCNRTPHQKIFVARNGQAAGTMDMAALAAHIQTLQHLADTGNTDQLRRHLEDLAAH